MRRGFALLTTLSLALAAQSSAAEKKDKQAEGLALINRAREVSDIRAPGSPPFRLEASVRLKGPSGEFIEGRYSLLWISSEQSREEIALPGYRRIRVIAPKQVWQVRNPRYLPLRLHQLDDALHYYSRLKLESEEKVKTLRSRNYKGTHQRCLTVKVNQWTDRELCLDEATGAIAREQNWALTYEYTDHYRWRDKIIPGTARVVEEEEEVVSFQLEEITDIGEIDSSHFLPPVGVEVKRGCEHPELGQAIEKQEPVYPESAKRARASGTVSIYAVVGTDGRLHDLTVIRSAGADLDNSTLQAVSRWRYDPARCDGEPVEVETFIDVKYRLYYPR